MDNAKLSALGRWKRIEAVKHYTKKVNSLHGMLTLKGFILNEKAMRLRLTVMEVSF